MQVRPRIMLWLSTISIVAASCGGALPIGPIMPIPAAAVVGCIGAVAVLLCARNHCLLPPDVE